MHIEKYYLKKLTKVFTEGVDDHWWFDIEKYIRVASKYDLNARQLQRVIECTEPDEGRRAISPKTIGRVMGYYNGEKEGRGAKSVTLDTVKALGRALCDGDEYGLLIKIEPTNVLKIMREAEELWGGGELNHIYRLLNNILYEMESSAHYSHKPGAEEDGYDYYDMKLQSIRKDIDSHFWNRSNTREKLYRLVEEVEYLTKSFSIPGAPRRWMEINPKLRYFDCVFAIKSESPETYESIKNREITCVHLSFYPTDEECQCQKLYFENLGEKNQSNNRRYSYLRLYQNEIVETFRMVFETDFAKCGISYQ